MKRTGELLRKAREEKGLSVHEVGMFLKINTRIIQSIEEGDQTNLPAKTFLRGFIQSYAKFLKLDVQQVLQTFTEDMAPPPSPLADATSITHESSSETSSTHKSLDARNTEEAPKVDVQTRESDSLKNSILTKATHQSDTLRVRTIVISVIGLLLVFVIYFANSVIKRYQREAELAPEVTENLTSPTTSGTTLENSPSLIVGSEKNDPASSSLTQVAPSPTPSLIAPQGVLTTPPAPTPVAAPTPPAPTTLKPSVTNPAPAAPVATPKPAAPTTASSGTTSLTNTPLTATTGATPTTNGTNVKPTTLEGKLVEVIVEAKQNVEIEYSSSKSSPQKLVLKADQIHTFKSRSGVRLKISNGGAVNVIVNGRDLGVPGASGQPVQVSYD